MTVVVGQMESLLSLNAKQFVEGLERARAVAQSNIGKINRTMSTLESGAKLASRAMASIGIAVAGIGAKQIIRLADNYKMLQARVQNVTAATGDYIAVSRQLASIASGTGSSLDDTVSTFQRLTIGAKELGKTNQEVLALTRTVQQLGILGGASAEELKNGLTQFSQAMAGGIMRAEEFNSIIENTPLLAQKIAEGMGLTIGQLRQAVLAGKVLSKDVFEVLQKQAGAINTEFSKMPSTFERALGKLGIALSNAVGQIDSATGATGALATGLNFTADILSKMTPFVSGVARGLVGVGQALAGGIASVFTVVANMVMQGVRTVAGGVNDLIRLYNNAFTQIKIMGVGLPKVGYIDTRGLSGAANATQKAQNTTVNFAKGGLNKLFTPAKTSSFKASEFKMPALKPLAFSSGGTGFKASKGGGGSRGGKSGSSGSVASFKAEAPVDPIVSWLASQIDALKTGVDLYNEELAKLDAARAKGYKELTPTRYNAINEALKNKYGVQDPTRIEVKSPFGDVDNMFAGSIKGLNSTIDQMNKGSLQGSVDKFAELENAVRNWGRTFEEQFIGSITTGKFEFASLASSVLADISRMALRLLVIEPITNRIGGALKGAASGGGSNVLGAVIGGIGKAFGGFFADGGVAPANKLSIVGEKGPELIMPTSSARVFSNSDSQALLSGGGGSVQNVTQNFYIQATDVQTFADQLKRQAGMIKSIAISAVDTKQYRLGQA